ncbi:very-short-patch-repair endonuclease [Bradyrhizobium niftali]|uniref:AAA domain-containing protein n=1 Tax=Bradyrhizobium niftali TaxID=2560055 RepID=UPI00383535DD
MADVRQKLIGLLDYVEQVVRLDERVSFRLSEYHLPDGTSFTIRQADTRNLPGIRHDHNDDDGPIWLELERLTRKEPPARPEGLADWIVVSGDPAKAPDVRFERLVTVSAAEKDAALAAGKVRADDVLEAPRKRGDAETTPPQYDLRLRLEDRPELAEQINQWIEGPWSEWSALETPRRRTISLYQSFYKVFQLLEVGGAESPIEVIWGIGEVDWHKEGRVIDRPLLERRVDIELDDKRGGMIRVRPAGSDAQFDLKPYEELGCTGLASLADLMRREIQRAGENEGVSPFARDSFEPILSAAGVRLDRDGSYVPESETASSQEANTARLTVSDRWVLFARPRSQHVILQDIDRLRNSAESEKEDIVGLPERLVTEPAKEVSGDGWQPLSERIGGSGGGPASAAPQPADQLDVFFPKPFNDDQLEIIRRLTKADGLVVQGPPGTGKTHTIANLICHAMATGQRVLVVSRGEAALSVLKNQLPAEVQPLAISVISSEREGLRQVESAIREIQGVVEGSQPQSRRATIDRIEAELDGLRQRIAAIDVELDKMATAHLTKIGPRGETPAEVAKRIVAERDAFVWFSDRPDRFASETSLDERLLTDLFAARSRCGDLIDHLNAKLPSPHDLPAANDVAGWHDDLISAAEHQQAATQGPVRNLRVAQQGVAGALAVAHLLESLKQTFQACQTSPWLDPFRRAALLDPTNAWFVRLHELLTEMLAADTERAQLMRRAVTVPEGFVDNFDAREAIDRAAAGQRLWPIVAIGKGEAKTLVAGIRVNGGLVRDTDAASWQHVKAVIANLQRQRDIRAQWDEFASEVGCPRHVEAKTSIELARTTLKACQDVRSNAGALTALTSDEVSLARVADDPALCEALAEQIRAAAASIRLASAELYRDQTLAKFDGDDRTSTLARQLFEEVLGKPVVASEKVSQVWTGLLKRLDRLKELSPDFAIILRVTAAISAAGAPNWATMLASEPAAADDAQYSASWRDAWDHAAADAALARIDMRQRLTALATEREGADKRCRQLFGELVRERTFYQLERRLSPAIKTALVEFVRALARIGRGTGKSAWTHRRTARDAMAKCYGAVPCWIMPTWRVAEQLPAELGAVELVIIDEASQSDITELPALLRGKKILVVGDDRQVSPTAPFVTQEKIAQLRHHYLGDMPFKSLLEPGESIYDLMRAVFPNERLMLKEHFRCVEPIVRFSMQFYPEKMIPLRVPEAHERLDPPLIDIYVPYGRRSRKKVNEAEADVIVREIGALVASPEMRERSIGVISLVGAEQSEHIRGRLSETIGEELMQRHAILCGDSATFQGSERDIVFLSMVADPANKTALTMLRYEQRFNVAVSRARDRVVLVRSVRREELNPNDLKARLIAHFENPMPEVEVSADAFALCDSDFERDVMGRLLQLGYSVRPQVGSLGYRIDMVVEGANGRRLAVECDGDRYHGPEQWRQDMRRQRVLERVGWRFWRSFASSYYRDTDAVIGDLVAMLTRMGIEPTANTERSVQPHRYTEHRIAELPASVGEGVAIAERNVPIAEEVAPDEPSTRIKLSDKVVLFFADTNKRLSVRLFDEGEDLDKGRLSVHSALGVAVCSCDAGDEIEYRDGNVDRKVLVESVERSLTLEPSLADSALPAKPELSVTSAVR